MRKKFGLIAYKNVKCWVGVGMKTGMVELRVADAGEEILQYSFATIQEASEMLQFLKDFFPAGTFVIQPLRH